MPDPLAGLPPRFLGTPEAARFLALPGRTLEKHRTYGTGPKYRKIGGRIVYALDDLQAWADLGAKKSTSDPGAGGGSRKACGLRAGGADPGRSLRGDCAREPPRRPLWMAGLAPGRPRRLSTRATQACAPRA